MQAHLLEGGFDDAPRAASFAFRALMNAMARPGRIEWIEGACPPAPISAAAGAVLLTLADGDTPIHLAGVCDRDDLRGWLAFHTGAPLVGPGEAVFAIGRWEDLLPLDAYPIGTAEYPDRSTTLIVDHAELANTGARLTGPGIETETRFALPDPLSFARNARLFPLGLDFYFTNGSQLAALPRSTRIG
ncbi:MAG: phosphonate C-P lyase system protein PhnH [Silicimonas sp.]|nr:phosphonate C-P lyase system protein PhnH [Silicimonas sp.]